MLLPRLGLEGTLVGGKFRLVRCIGAGGMGTVWEGEHIEIHRRVAVKVLNEEFAQNADAVARFRREAQIAGSLGHDNICEVLDVGVAPDGSQYLVMPLLRGSSFAEVIASNGPLPEARALDIIAQVLSALEAAHKVGVVHRDLKPENVFVTQVGDRSDFVKVLDFGISKVVATSALIPSSMTRTGTVMGTPHYMSPEQARGQKDLDRRVDVYATGVMLYEALTGRRPYEGETFNELIIKIVTERFAPPRSMRPDISPHVEAIVLRSMERERDARYPDASEMRADVLAASQVVADAAFAIPLTPGARAGARSSVRAMTPGQGVAPSGVRRAPTPAATSTHEPERRGGYGRLVGLVVAAILLVGGVVGAVFAFSSGGDRDAPMPTAVPMMPAVPPPLPRPPAVAATPETTVPATAAPGAADETSAPAGRASSDRSERPRRWYDPGSAPPPPPYPTTQAPAPQTVAPPPVTAAPATTRPPDPPRDRKVLEGRGGVRIKTVNE